MPFWVGGTGNITDAANHWAATTGGAPGAGNLPTSATNAIFDANSGANAVITVDGAFNCLDFDMSACAATPTLAGSAALNVFGSFALKAGMTRTYTGAITFSATATGKTINTNGVALASALNFTGSGGGWTLGGAINTTGNISHAAGSANYAGFSINCAAFTMNQAPASVTLGAATVTLTAFWSITNGTLSAALSNITLGSNFNFQGNGNAYGSVTVTSGANISISGANSFVNLTILNTASKSTALAITANQTITGTLKYLGNSATNRLLIQSDVIGTARTLTVAAIDAASNDVDFMDIAGAGAAAPFATGSRLGDCGGNSGITFTAPATQTATGTASFAWSTHGWTSRVPLPQDDVVISNAFIAGRTITADMPRLGKSVTFSCTGNPALSVTATSSYFGSLTLAAGMTCNVGNSIAAQGRGANTLRTNGVSMGATPGIVVPVASGGSLTLLDALTVTAAAIPSFESRGGVVNGNGFSVTLPHRFQMGFSGSGGTLNMGGGAWLITGAGGGQPWSILGGTVNAQGSTLTFTDTSATVKVFAGGGQTYGAVWFNNGGAGGAWQFTGSNSFGTFKADPGATLQFTAGTTQQITNWQANGTAGNLVTIDSITAASHTLNFTQNPGHVDGDYLNIAHSTATPANWWFAGSHSTNSGNNSGWVFADYVGMVANANVIASVTPQLTTSIILQASESVQTAWSGSLGTGIICRTAMQASASITAPLTTAIPMAASLLDVATLAANLVGNNCEDFEVPTSPHVFAVPDQPHVFKA